MAAKKPSPLTKPSAAFKIDGETPLDRELRLRDNEVRGLKAQLEEATARVKRHQTAAAEWEERFNQLAALKQVREPLPRLTLPKEGEHRGLVLALWSDWHVAEVVQRSKVSGRNAYSPEIAARRAQCCAANTVRIFRHLARSYKVDTLVLYLLGDFVTGYLHEELAQTNAMGTVEEGIYAEKLLIGALEQVIEAREIKRVRLICHRGNHGRTTRKMQFKNDFETSHETWIYSHLRDVFGRSAKVEFVIPEPAVYLEEVLPHWSVRSFHGHQVRYQDGVGGLSIPLNKWEAKQDKTEKAAFNVMGHWHSYSSPNATTILNGSLKGYDEYAAENGFAFQEPLQALALLDTQRRMVAQHLPIFCA